MEKIDAIILAGGLGTRLRALIKDMPKVLAPVNGRPFLDLLLNSLNKSKIIKSVILAVGYLSDKIIKRYTNCKDYDFKILFSEEKELLGTGGAIKQALQYVNTDSVLVLNGDSYIAIDIEDLFEAYKKNNTQMIIVLKEVEDASRYGRVNLDVDSRIVSFEEKKAESESGYINAGIYLFKKKLFDEIEGNKVLSMEKDLLPYFVKDVVYGYISSGRFIDIGIPETYEVSDEYLKGM